MTPSGIALRVASAGTVSLIASSARLTNGPRQSARKLSGPRPTRVVFAPNQNWTT